MSLAKEWRKKSKPTKKVESEWITRVDASRLLKVLQDLVAVLRVLQRVELRKNDGVP